ncbi:MAG: alpha/beta hydrolase [bacterium]|nr:alpha/beta hydrolase [bacterium]
MNKIVILHGWTYSNEKWSELINLLQQESRTVLIPPIPGLSGSIMNKPWELNDYIIWLEEQLMNEDTIILIGHSNGGRIATRFAAKHPNKIEKLILIDTAGLIRKEKLYILKKKFFEHLSKVGKKLTSSTYLEKLLYKLVGESDYHQAEPQMKATMLNLISTDLIEDFKKLTIPTLIIWGGDDTITPIYQAEEIHTLIPQSKLYIVKNARHSPFYTDAQEVFNSIKSFI